MELSKPKFYPTGEGFPGLHDSCTCLLPAKRGAIEAVSQVRNWLNAAIGTVRGEMHD
jgi:hypothetical protein